MAWSHKNFTFMTNSYKHLYSTQAFNDIKPHKFMCIASNEIGSWRTTYIRYNDISSWRTICIRYNDINSWRTNNLFASGKYFTWLTWGEIIGIHVWVALDEISLL